MEAASKNLEKYQRAKADRISRIIIALLVLKDTTELVDFFKIDC